MSNNAIRAQNLSKQYEIGMAKQRHNTLRDQLAEGVGSLFRPDGRKSAKTIWALKNVSFEVKQGEVLGIIGRNGAGKTTLLKILSRITEPTSGRAEVYGRVGSLLEVGTGFHPELSGRENIYLSGSILGMKKREIDATLGAIVEFSGVEKFVDTPIKRYSSGMRLRLGFAVAAHLRPDVLLIDEVLAVGDLDFQKKCLQAMSGLGTSGRTVLFVSHDLAAIENLCPRTIWINNGQIQEDDHTRDVIEKYLSSFAADNQSGRDLSNVRNRSGSGKIRYTEMEFSNRDGQSRNLVRSGDSLTVRLYFHARQAIRKPHFGLEIYTELGTLVTDVSTWASGYEIPILPQGDGYIDLEITLLNLMPGRYYVGLWLAGLGTGDYDRLNKCAVLDIEHSNFYQSGRGIDKKLGIIFLPCKWRSHTLDAFVRDGSHGEQAQL